MECLKSSSAVSVIIDREGSEDELCELRNHVAACSDCSAAVDDTLRLRQGLLRLPAKTPPPELQPVLFANAQEHQTGQVFWLNVTGAISRWRVRASLMLNDLMRPMALPIAGGVASAFLLFALLAPDMAVEMHPISNDVPTVLFTNPSVKDASWPVIGETDVVVDLTIDESGRLTDYSIVSGGPLLRDEGRRRRFESALLLTQFTPANFFGTPMSGKVRVSFRTSRIDIKG